MWLFMSSFFHLASSVLHSFLWRNNFLLYGNATLCLSIYWLMNIWVVSTIWLLWTQLLWIFAYKFLFEQQFSKISRLYICFRYSFKIIRVNYKQLQSKNQKSTGIVFYRNINYSINSRKNRETTTSQ